MTPIRFKHCNGTLGGGPAAKYGTEDDVIDLPVFRGLGTVISCWRLSFWERLIVLFTGRVWLSVLGTNHAPVKVESSSPFVEETP